MMGSRRSQLMLCAITLTLAMIGSHAAADSQTARVYIPAVLRQPPSYAQQVIALINQERAARGIPCLEAHPALIAAAAAHSQDMAATGVLSHTGSDGSSPGDRIRRAGYEPNSWGECVAAGYPTPAEVVAGWMNSPAHRDILLSRSFVHIGAGHACADDSGTTHYWTVNVASPA